ncbi:FAD-dependent oxidoreductase, partial [archaeon]
MRRGGGYCPRSLLSQKVEMSMIPGLVPRLLGVSIPRVVAFCEEERFDSCDSNCHPPIPTSKPGHGKVVFASEVQRNSKLLNSVHPNDAVYDVAVVGAGVVGSAIAYRLSMLHGIKTILLDENIDVGEGTSKANSAIIHTGFDADPGTLESHLLQEASQEWPSLAAALKIPYESIGALLIATTADEKQQLEEVLSKARKNSVTDCVLLSKERVLALDPAVTPTVLGGVLIPREAIADPFATPIAYAEVAVENGVDVCLGASVVAIQRKNKSYNEVVLRPSPKDCPPSTSTSPDIIIKAKHIINAAGLGSRDLALTYSKSVARELEINPRRGEFLVLSPQIVNHIILPLPNELTKGVLVSPTIFGNTLCGPTAVDLPVSMCRDVPKVTQFGLDEVKKGGGRLVPSTLTTDIVTTYAGHRCNRKGGSYFVHHDREGGVTTIGGVRSTGLSTSPSFSRYVVDQIFPNARIRQDAVRTRERYPSWYEKRLA